jgi:hypothetical protein
MNMNMTIDELVNAQIRDYLSSEDFINKYDTEQMITDEIENRMCQYLNSYDADEKYATLDYVDEEIRQQVRSTIDADEYATEEFVRDLCSMVQAELKATERVIDVVYKQMHELRKELHLEGLVPAEKQKPVNQLDQFVSPDGLIAGYHDFETLTTFMGASLVDPNQKQMVVAMVLATVRNIIQEQLDNDH